MSSEAKDYYGKDVASAIKEACSALSVAQENLNIEVVETGSTGIFGLIRKKAHIRVTVQVEEEEGQKVKERPKTSKPKPKPKPKPKKAAPVKAKPKLPTTSKISNTDETLEGDNNHTDKVDGNSKESNLNEDNGYEQSELSAESLEIIRVELDKILQLMSCPSTVTIENIKGTAVCKVGSEFEDDLTGQDGRTLDSLQYLLRKIVSRRTSERVRLTIDVGNYRERRHQELRDTAIDYAALVKVDGKTQVIPSLNPSERRVVHVALQDDNDIRSRSVGDGLFKKVLIYKPGKGRKNNGRKRPPRGKYRKKSDTSENKES